MTVHSRAFPASKKNHMKKNILFAVALFAAGSLFADSNPKNDVIAAATALGDQANYSWHAAVEVPPDAQFKPGPIDGKTEKNGYTLVTANFNDNSFQTLMKGTNIAIKTEDNGWQTSTEAMDDGGGTAFIARMAQNFKAPAAEAATLAGESKDLKAGTNGISGDLTEDGAKTLLVFRRHGNEDGPTVANPKGTVIFWLADGKLSKYQYHVTGTVTFNGNDYDVDRTTTTEIKNVGATKIEVPDDAKKKLL
jgi:hypothetical protein